MGIWSRSPQPLGDALEKIAYFNINAIWITFRTFLELFERTIGGHGTLQKYRGTGTRYFAKISTAVPVLSN